VAVPAIMQAITVEMIDIRMPFERGALADVPLSQSLR